MFLKKRSLVERLEEYNLKLHRLTEKRKSLHEKFSKEKDNNKGEKFLNEEFKVIKKIEKLKVSKK